MQNVSSYSYAIKLQNIALQTHYIESAATIFYFTSTSPYRTSLKCSYYTTCVYHYMILYYIYKLHLCALNSFMQMETTEKVGQTIKLYLLIGVVFQCNPHGFPALVNKFIHCGSNLSITANVIVFTFLKPKSFPILKGVVARLLLKFGAQIIL